MLTAYVRQTERVDRVTGIAQVVLALYFPAVFRSTRTDEQLRSAYSRAKHLVTSTFGRVEEFGQIGNVERLSLAAGEIKTDNYRALLDSLRHIDGLSIRGEQSSGVIDYLDSLFARVTVLESRHEKAYEKTA